MISVLFLALEFPPVSTTGMHRSAKLAKYLPEHGVEPVVLTMKAEDGAASFEAPIEPELLQDLPPLPIYRFAAYPERPLRSRALRFARIWSRAEDSLARRMRTALRDELPKLIQRHRPKAVYVSMPPFSSGRLAAEIARDFALPLIVDMRDGWSHWCAGAFPTYLHWRVVLERERRLFRSASAVVTVTPQLAEIFRRTHREIDPSRFHVVPNGYDGALELPEMILTPTWSPNRPISVGYVGRFYYAPESRAAAVLPWWRRPGHRKLHYYPVVEDWLYRSPNFFFAALAELRRRSPELGRLIRFELVGAVPDWLPNMAEAHGVTDALKLHGRVPAARVPELLAGFDALLCTAVKVIGGEDYALASKTFEYVTARKPILGLVTRGSQRDFLEASGTALVADPDDLEASAEALRTLAQGGLRLEPNLAFLQKYQRRHAAESIATIIREAVATPPRPPKNLRSNAA